MTSKDNDISTRSTQMSSPTRKRTGPGSTNDGMRPENRYFQSQKRTRAQMPPRGAGPGGGFRTGGSARQQLQNQQRGPDFDRSLPLVMKEEQKPTPRAPRLFDPHSDDVNTFDPHPQSLARERDAAPRSKREPRRKISRESKEKSMPPRHIATPPISRNLAARPPISRNIAAPPPASAVQFLSPSPQSPIVSSHIQRADEDDEESLRMFKQPETRPISPEQLLAEVKGIYAGLIMVEAKCCEVDAKQHEATMEIDGRQARLNNEQWQALIALHRTLLHEHHDFFLASQHPSASPSLKRLAQKYAMPARMWRHGIHSFLELLRHRLPHSLEHMLTFIYLAYSMMALLYETVPAFEETWIECLGDLGRYRMTIDQKDRDVWQNVSRHFKRADKMRGGGRLYHHLAILSRANPFEKLFYHCKSLSATQPFSSALKSIPTVFDPVFNLRPAHTRFKGQNFDIPFTAYELESLGKALEKFSETSNQYIDRRPLKRKLKTGCTALLNLTSQLSYDSGSSLLRKNRRRGRKSGSGNGSGDQASMHDRIWPHSDSSDARKIKKVLENLVAILGKEALFKSNESYVAIPTLIPLFYLLVSSSILAQKHHSTLCTKNRNYSPERTIQQHPEVETSENLHLKACGGLKDSLLSIRCGMDSHNWLYAYKDLKPHEMCYMCNALLFFGTFGAHILAYFPPKQIISQSAGGPKDSIQGSNISKQSVGSKHRYAGFIVTAITFHRYSVTPVTEENLADRQPPIISLRPDFPEVGDKLYLLSAYTKLNRRHRSRKDLRKLFDSMRRGCVSIFTTSRTKACLCSKILLGEVEGDFCPHFRGLLSVSATGPDGVHFTDILLESKHWVAALQDTGASHNLVSRAYVNSAGLMMQKGLEHFCTVDRRKVVSIGSCKLKVQFCNQLGTRYERQVFYVLETLPFNVDVILSCTFLEETGSVYFTRPNSLLLSSDIINKENETLPNAMPMLASRKNKRSMGGWRGLLFRRKRDADIQPTMIQDLARRQEIRKREVENEITDRLPDGPEKQRRIVEAEKRAREWNERCRRAT